MKPETDKKKSDIILNELKQRDRGAKVVDVEEEKTKLVIFSLSGDFYAFYGSNIKEILPIVNIFFVPGTPDFILGLINLRGDIESVIDISHFLSLPAVQITQNSRIVIAENDGVRSGIILESVVDVADVPANSIKPSLSMLDKTTKEFVAGETMFNGKNVTLLDVGQVLERIKD